MLLGEARAVGNPNLRVGLKESGLYLLVTFSPISSLLVGLKNVSYDAVTGCMLSERPIRSFAL